MKTNKEIKPFKMQVTTKESERIQSFLACNGYGIADMWDNHNVIILSSDTLYSYHGRYLNLENEPEPELTYSEFMKLYGEEEEMFTREDMKAYGDFLSWYSKYKPSGSIGTYKYLFEEINSDALLTNFLSERTND